MSRIRDLSLAPEGERKIEWVKSYMPLLNRLECEFGETRPLSGLNVSVSVHLEAKTAYLCRVLLAAGANVFATGSNPFSTQDDVAAALAQAGANVFAWHGATPEEYEAHLVEALSSTTAATSSACCTAIARTSRETSRAAARKRPPACSAFARASARAR